MKIISTTDLKNIPEVLRAPAQPVSDVAEVAALFDEFIQTLHDTGGLGLAAPQVGISKRFIAIHNEPEGEKDKSPKIPLTFLINPEIVKISEKALQWEEGCLSLPGYVGTVIRAESLKVQGLNRFGKKVTVKASGLYACVLQHEIDHLDGVLFTDKAENVHLGQPDKEKRAHVE
jgi:peptide deformylase